VKYILAQQPGGQQPRQLILNAQQLQGLLQGGGNTITLNSATGKVTDTLICMDGEVTHVD